MPATTITPFIDSVRSVFLMMLQSNVTCTGPVIGSPGPDTAADVSGVVGMSGDFEGSVVVHFSFEAARRVVARFAGEELPVESEDFADAIGELVNMITGGAKAQFDGRAVDITVPSVVIGESHRVHPIAGAMIQSFRGEGELGAFTVEVALRDTADAVHIAAGDDVGATS